MTHIVLFSGGHSSAIVAIEVVRRFGKENVVLLNHDLNQKYEDDDIKRFKREVAGYLNVPITYANFISTYDGDNNPERLPSQFKVCIDAGALTDQKNMRALCTSRLKTMPFEAYLKEKYNTSKESCIIYYGFDAKEQHRIQRRSGILGAKGYKTDYPLAFWKERTIHSTREIGIEPSNTYSVFQHANCKGCLKASLLHWYVTYVHYPEIYQEAIEMEEAIDFTIHTIIRDGKKRPIELNELAIIFEKMKQDDIPATEHQSKMKFAHLIRKYQIEECITNKPCECIA